METKSGLAKIGGQQAASLQSSFPNGVERDLTDEKTTFPRENGEEVTGNTVPAVLSI